MSADFDVQRAMMIEGQLRTRDVTHVPLLEAMSDIPREAFVPDWRKSLAYMDEDLEIVPAGEGRPARYLMEPAPFARMVQLAEVGPSDRVLDVGCATGYSSAVLSRIAGSVVALECDSALADRAAQTLARLNCSNVSVIVGDLGQGHAKEAPYDVILFNGAVDYVPEVLVEQLAEGGRLVAIIGEGNAARAHLYVKEGGVVSSRPDFNAAVKRLPGFRKEAGFVF